MYRDWTAPRPSSLNGESFDQLMRTYGLPGTVQSTDFSVELPLFDDSSPRAFDPVLIAASSRTFPSLLAAPCTSSTGINVDTNAMRRRSSLVEAFNNGSLYGCSDSDDIEAEERLNMLKRRAGITPVQRPLKYPSQNIYQQSPQQYPPRTLVRSYAHQVRERRARSQPLHQIPIRIANVDDSEDEKTHLSRADRFSIDSEAGRSSHDSGIRSSTHSNSSATTSSSISSVHEENAGLLLAEALWDHVAMLTEELPFQLGDVVTVLDSTSNSRMWYGSCNGKVGWFPSNYVRVRKCQMDRLSDLSNIDATVDEYPKQMRILRRRVVEELMDTERDYVKLLDNLVHGFVEQCRRRKEMFDEERIRKIFSNIEQISLLHHKLLRDLEIAFNQKAPESSCVANAFLRNSHNFATYTEYCNNRPISCNELEQLERQPQYHHFFEACRLLRGMAKLSLEGFLLTPVQRICRYPLQLYELLKATPATHPDRYPLEQAHRTMKAMASHVNDAKRRIDAIQKIVLWQKNVHGFRGPDLIDNNHRILISGELQCKAVVNNMVQWSKTVHVYMFDQSIVICKKDVLKKNSLIFKERMSLQCTNVVDLPDGKDVLTGSTIRNGFKLSGPKREYVFCCVDPATKSLWLDTFRQRPRPQPPTNLEKRLALVTLAMSMS
ncbi:unnamed protein product [Bursaphelenchus okinawaensis]|uniref:DH domain-containing protein n=1 Tax=Bursaphelenchus okinawaensis TaxID=465554 RepID=A0A811LMR9_9BILA|nr:unnamed protein product [Bursaphelenchus okinawaensis]CAG9126993.1 unnamed protein product [Bursaphelenchus okinawaensis]